MVKRVNQLIYAFVELREHRPVYSMGVLKVPFLVSCSAGGRARNTQLDGSINPVWQRLMSETDGGVNEITS